MTRDDIIRMAREAQLENFSGDMGHWFHMEVKDLARFAALVTAAKDAEHQQTLALQQRSYEREIKLEVEDEREACAKLCEETTAAWTQHLYNSGCVDCAAAIRARGNT